jgi:signal transduction histidine kinase
MSLSQLAPPASANGNPVPPVAAETGIDNFLSLVQRELVAPLGKVAELSTRLEELRAAGYLPTTLEGQKIFAELAAASRHSADTAARLIDLGDLLVGSPILADEYILVADSLHTAAAELSEAATDHGVGLRLDESHNNLAPVYGSGRWLTLALRRLLSLLVDAAPVGAHVLTRLRQVGFHQLLTAGINHNQPAPITLNLLRTESRSTVKAAVADSGSVQALDLALATAVIELHGGTLKTDVTETGALNQFTLTLPTGAPQALRRRPDCTNCPSMHQTEQFARDIGELLNAMQSEQQHTSNGSRK